MKIPLLLLLILVGSCTYGQDIHFEFRIDHLKTSDGCILVSVFENQKNFENNILFKQEKIPKQSHIQNGVFCASVTLPVGTYGITFIDDVNCDGELSCNAWGKPKEGYGFTNYYHSGHKRPEFSDFSFELNEETKIQDIRLRYM